jgi:hypothetical protein
MINVIFPIVAPEAVIYQVTVRNESSRFQWDGEVSAMGEVTEFTAHVPESVEEEEEEPKVGTPVFGWPGYVLSTSAGSQFDDYVVFLPKGAGEVGIRGSDENLEAEIVALRGSEDPGKVAHFWGTLACDVPDYGDCQLLVTRVRSGTDVTGPEPVMDLQGKMYGFGGGVQFDDRFVLTGDFPVGFGIASYIADSGLPLLAESLENLRDSDTILTVSGELTCGVPDVNGCQIQVRRLVVDGQLVNPFAGWIAHVNVVDGYQLQIPPEANIQEEGVTGFPEEELPEGMEPDEYLAQLQAQLGDRLCLSIQVELGSIYISSPQNDDFRYTTCGRTGVGAGELIEKTEEVYINEKYHNAIGFEFIGADDTLLEHNETMVIKLDDDTRIEFGSLPIEGAMYEEYLRGTKQLLLKILSTFTTVD